MLLFALALLAPASEPPPVPSGMDLLYGDRVGFTPSGEPIVAVGISKGQKTLVFDSARDVVLDYWDDGVAKRSVVPPGKVVEVTLSSSIPAKRQYYVDLEGIAHDDTAALTRARDGWKARGYKVETLEEGTVLGLAGRVLDNREYRLVLPMPNSAEAARLVREVYERFGTSARVGARLLSRPSGELSLRIGGVPAGRAESFVRLMAVEGGTVRVRDVEYGQGYAWHGKETRGYHGEIYAVVDPDNGLAATNVTGAETILRGVVPAELFANSPKEALRAQAVAARNHLLSKLGKRHHDDPFHLCSEQHCQVYAGVNKEDPRANEAVASTAGQALFLGGRLVDCVYSSSCGGHTEDNDVVWGDVSNPALRGRPDLDDRETGLADLPGWLRGVPKSYCQRASLARPERFRWSKTLTRGELDELVHKVYPNLGTVQRLSVEERGIGGRAVSLRIEGSKAAVSVVRELSIRKLFGNLNSGAFVLEETRDAAGALLSVTFVGGGWGHGVGMCQMGAIGRAEAGQSYRDILRHYYNGAQVEQLYESVL